MRNGLAQFKAGTWKLGRMRKGYEKGGRPLSRGNNMFHICIKMFRDEKVEGIIF
jgi:hypothetical protein